MTSDEYEHAKCKNGHAIMNIEGKIILLKGNVVRCNRCGNMFTVQEIPVIYLEDIFTEGGSRVHLYNYLRPWMCLSCGAWISRHAVECLSAKSGDENYEHYKKIGMPNGFVRN